MMYRNPGVWAAVAMYRCAAVSQAAKNRNFLQKRRGCLPQDSDLPLFTLPEPALRVADWPYSPG